MRKMKIPQSIKDIRNAVAVGILTLSAFLSVGLILRHDVPDKAYIELAKAYPQLCHFADGEGTLIASQWVVTAAHVAEAIKEGLTYESQEILCNDQSYEIEEVIVHPEFALSPASIANDIALVKLKKPVTGVEPARLYSKQDEKGKLITVIGRGDTGTGLTGPVEMDKINRAGTNKVDGSDEEWIYFKFDGPDSPNTTPMEAISGPGDSGGPAFFDDGDTRYILGVSSFQDGEVGEGRYGVTEYYARVSAYKNWIEETISTYKPTAKAPQANQPSPLGIYAGTYEGDRTIRIHQNTIKYRRGGGPYLTLRPKGENLYEFQLPKNVVSENPLPEARFTFDANGKVTGLILVHENRTDNFKKLD